MSTATVMERSPVHIEGQEQIEPGLGELERPLRYIEVDRITPGSNPRRERSEQFLERLTSSVGRMGNLQSVLVRELDGDRYEMVAGEQRWLSARRAGRPRVPAMVLGLEEELDEPTLRAMAFAENSVRQKLKPLEEAMLLAGLVSDFGLSLAGAAEHLEMSRELAEERIALLELPGRVRERLAAGELTLRNAATLAPIAAKSPGVAEALGERVASGAQSQSALDGDPAAALRRLADEEQASDRAFLIPFGPHDTVNLDEVTARIGAATAEGLVAEGQIADVEEALKTIEESLASVPAELRTAHVSEPDTDRARAFGGLIEYREGAYRRSGVLIDAAFAADWARGAAAELAENGGETERGGEPVEMPAEREDPKAARERRKEEALRGKSANGHLDRELTNRFDHQSEVSLDQARVIAVLFLEFLGREIAGGHRVVREAWLKRDFRPARGGPRMVEEYPSVDEITGLLEAEWRKASSGPALIGRIFAACVSAIFADQSVLGAAARPNLELPYTLGREEQLQGLAPAALWREAEGCLGEERAAELAPLFTSPEAGAEPGRDRLARSADLSGEALELMPEGDPDDAPDPADAEPAGAGAA
ncbi:MAG: ParB/RepB/Spo0J family partition protein [Actinobacteria bacterium]|nr:ParB/RepB/Spo0J family partition protein [Actinomycetota bacterium]MBS1883526.1 ParB/RepB/Spo0J family partition protein [Actinomycetota bacterium]